MTSFAERPRRLKRARSRALSACHLEGEVVLEPLGRGARSKNVRLAIPDLGGGASVESLDAEAAEAALQRG